MANNVPKLPGLDYVAKNWALAMMLKALPLVHFWSILSLNDLCQKNIKNVGLISAKLINFQRNLPKNNHKIRCFLTDCFLAKFALKIPVKSADFSSNLSLKIPQNLTFFFRDLSEALCILHVASHKERVVQQLSCFGGVE